jgi:uncharacterized membrane protein YkoI
MRTQDANSTRRAQRLGPALLAACLALVWQGPTFEAAAEDAMAKAPRVSKEQAVKKAMAVVPGEVTDVSVEKKRGREVWVVEIVAEKNGVETDVLVDMDSGRVIGTEQ